MSHATRMTTTYTDRMSGAARKNVIKQNETRECKRWRHGAMEFQSYLALELNSIPKPEERVIRVEDVWLECKHGYSGREHDETNVFYQMKVHAVSETKVDTKLRYA